MSHRWVQVALLSICLACTAAAAPEAEEVLTPLQQRRSEQAVDRALQWLATQQAADGSFRTSDLGQPGVTGLCVLAYLSRGHLPGQGEYGQRIERAIGYILHCQKDDGAILFHDADLAASVRPVGQAATYNHAISALALAEAYGMADRPLSQKMKPAIEKALDFTLKLQRAPKERPKDVGGWRYLIKFNHDDSDLSVTSWHLLFLRSAKNAGFAIPGGAIDLALDYVQRSFDPAKGTFQYIIQYQRPLTRAMSGAGILSMSLAGMHDTPIARAAGDWILQHPFEEYLGQISDRDRYFYGVFYCTQAMFQLGGNYWRRFFPQTAQTLLDHQGRQGDWDPETAGAAQFGRALSTALSVLALDTPHQLLPIFQR